MSKPLLTIIIVLGTCLTPLIGSNTFYNDFKEQQNHHVILAPRHKTMLSSEVASVIKMVSKKMGEPFKEGEVLIQLDDAVFRGQHSKAQAEVQRAETDLNAKQQLFNDGAASLAELKEAEAQVASAHAELILAEKNLNSCTLKAPYAGKVVNLNFEEHELVQPGEELIEIVDDAILVAKFLLPSVFLNRINIDDTIDIFIKEANLTVPATIKRISAVIDPSSSTIKVDAEVDNTTQKLKSGMTGTLTMTNP